MRRSATPRHRRRPPVAAPARPTRCAQSVPQQVPSRPRSPLVSTPSRPIGPPSTPVPGRRARSLRAHREPNRCLRRRPRGVRAPSRLPHRGSSSGTGPAPAPAQVPALREPAAGSTGSPSPARHGEASAPRRSCRFRSLPWATSSHATAASGRADGIDRSPRRPAAAPRPTRYVPRPSRPATAPWAATAPSSPAAP